MLFAERLQVEEAEHDETLARALVAAETYEDAVERKDQIIADYKERHASLRKRSLETASYRDLLDYANRVPPVHEDSDGDEVANTNGSGTGSVSH